MQSKLDQNQIEYRIKFHIEQMREKVEKNGFDIVLVFGGCNFGYTIGLYQSSGHPELIMVGGSDELLAGTLATAAQQIVIEGAVFKDGDLSTNIIEPNPARTGLRELSVAFKKVGRSSYQDWVGLALRYYGHKDFDLLQLIWPDTQGLFPWDTKFERRLKAMQPIIG